MPKKRERKGPKSEKPGLIAIAELFHDVSSERAAKTLQWLLESGGEIARQYAELQEIAAIAGVSQDLVGWELEAATLQESAEKLISTEEWSAPGEVLAVTDDQEVEPDWIGLWRLCAARAERRGPEAEAYAAAASKLQAISEKAQEEAALMTRVKEQLDELIERLDEHFRDPEEVDIFLEALVLTYKRRQAVRSAEREGSHVAHA